MYPKAKFSIQLSILHSFKVFYNKCQVTYLKGHFQIFTSSKLSSVTFPLLINKLHKDLFFCNVVRLGCIQIFKYLTIYYNRGS